jgi:branched-chain amino acid transport system substrate-binding protein
MIKLAVWLAILSVGLMVVVATSGCGSSSTDGTETTTTVAAPVDSTTTGETTGDQTETTAAPDAGAADDPYVIGLLSDLTGSLSFIGIPQRDAMKMEIDKANSEGGINGHPLKLIVEDEGSNAAKVTAAATKLIESDKVDVLVGPAWGALLPTVQAVAERAGVPYIYPGPADAVTREQIMKWCFSVAASPDPLAEATAGILKNFGYKAAVGIGDDWVTYQSALKSIEKMTADSGIKFTRLSDTFTAGAADLSSQAQKIKQAAEAIHAEAIVALTDGPSAAVLARNLNKLGVDLPIIGGYAYGSDATIKLVGDLKSQVIWADMKAPIYSQLPDGDPQKTLLTQYAEEYKAATGNELNSFAANIYTTMHIVRVGLEAGGHDKAKSRDAMEAIKGWVGANGTVNFSADKYGHEQMGVDGFCVLTVADGAFKLLGTFGTDGAYTPVK